MIGNVRRFFMAKGYGFIQDQSGQSYFFHCTNFLRLGAEGDERKPKYGEAVVFEVSTSVTGRSQAMQPFGQVSAQPAPVAASGLNTLTKGIPGEEF